LPPSFSLGIKAQPFGIWRDELEWDVRKGIAWKGDKAGMVSGGLLNVHR
jgi:hypothetical protein